MKIYIYLTESAPAYYYQFIDIAIKQDNLQMLKRNINNLDLNYYIKEIDSKNKLFIYKHRKEEIKQFIGCVSLHN